MTQFTEDQIETIRQNIVGCKVEDLYYEEDGDYFVMEFDNGTETSIRFMADLIKEAQ